MDRQGRWLVERDEFVILVDHSRQDIQDRSFMSNCLVDDFVTFSDLIVDSNLLPVDCDLADYDSISVVLGTECLELDFEDVEQL